MNLRKSSYFKPLCLLVAALFTCQCISFERKLISTEEKVIEDESREFIYELEKIKTPSTQDPTAEYRIVKFPANRVESISTYKKIDRSLPITLGIVGAVFGGLIAIDLKHPDIYKLLPNFFLGTLIGGLIGGSMGSSIKGKIREIKEPTRRYLTKKSDSTPIPIQNLPLEFKLGTGVKSNTFKTQTDEQGIVRINLIADLKMTKLPFDHPLTLFILYFNPESQKKGLFKDSLGPEK
ncbi:MAG TPA: hypothetical protein VK186_06320 [Candidatus Deferrimicrobium sp.]|nr:hypothetical protein [Candidatus Deferrimicrobium sp.]